MRQPATVIMLPFYFSVEDVMPLTVRNLADVDLLFEKHTSCTKDIGAASPELVLK